MDPQTIFLPAKPRVGRKRKDVSASPTPPPVTGPVLVSAVFEGGLLTLMFDRAIDIAALNFLDVFVLDAAVPVEWNGAGGAEMVGANGVAIPMIENAEYSGEQTLLNVPGGAGIVSIEGGAAWAGADELELPFP